MWEDYVSEVAVDYERLLQTYRHIGFQAAHFGLAVDEINRMISW